MAHERLEERYLTIQQVAEILNKSPRTIRRYIRERGLPHFRITPTTILIDRRRLEQWVDAQSNQPRQAFRRRLDLQLDRRNARTKAS